MVKNIERDMLRIDDLKIVFKPGTVNEKTALDGVSLKLAPGEFMTVIGGNGAGKSTLMNCVSGAYTPSSGSIAIDGTDVTRMKEHARAKLLGRVFQDPMMGTAGGMRLEENLAIAMRRGEKRTLRWGITKAERATYREALATLGLGLENRLDTKVKLLSGGQRQALTLLMATLKKPKLLLLDEHTAALDPKTAEKVLSLSETLIEENHLTAMMVTHNMRDAIRYGSRLIMMNEGRVLIDVSGDAKKRLTVETLINMFSRASGCDEVSDRLVL